MTTEVQERAEFKKLLDELPPPDRARVEAYAQALRGFIKLGGSHSLIAMTIVGQEIADQGPK